MFPGSVRERMAMVKGGAVAAIPGLGGGVDGNFTDNRSGSHKYWMEHK